MKKLELRKMIREEILREGKSRLNTQMKKLELRKMIREELLKEKESRDFIKSDKELVVAIKAYGMQSTELEKKKANIQKQLDEIEEIESTQKKQFRDIEKFMNRVELHKKKADKWVAKLEEQLKYQRIVLNYKSLYQEALNLVDKSTKKLLENMAAIQTELKSVETINVLKILKNESIIIESIWDKLKGLWTSFKNLFKSGKEYEQVVNKLPVIN